MGSRSEGYCYSNTKQAGVCLYTGTELADV